MCFSCSNGNGVCMRQEDWGLQLSQLWKNLQKSAIIGQKIGLKSAKFFVNNGSFIGHAPLNHISHYLTCTFGIHRSHEDVGEISGNNGVLATLSMQREDLYRS